MEGVEPVDRVDNLPVGADNTCNEMVTATGRRVAPKVATRDKRNDGAVRLIFVEKTTKHVQHR
jgi:hypothetical protein